jgi:hypothetical protein
MRHKLINKVKTRFYNKRMLVIIEFNDKEFIFIAPNSLKSITNLEVHEFELLVGSTIRVEFYKVGDTLFNGEKCRKDNLFLKEYFIELETDINVLRENKKYLLLPFEKITKIFHFDKFGHENVCIKTDKDNTMFFKVDRFSKATNIERTEHHILIDSYIYREFYKKGEILTSQRLVTEDNKILKWINIRFSDNINNMHLNFENSIGYCDGKDFSDNSNQGPGAYGYSSWEDMTLIEVFEGDASNYWNID